MLTIFLMYQIKPIIIYENYIFMYHSQLLRIFIYLKNKLSILLKDKVIFYFKIDCKVIFK